jgi:hypothetical protein
MGEKIVQSVTLFWGLTYRPIVFFKDHLGRPTSWPLALGGPFACVCLTMISQVIFVAEAAPALVHALSGPAVPASFVLSMQYMGVFSAASVFLVVWLVASAVMIACDVLFTGTDSVVRVLEVNALALYSQVPWLVALVALAWAYQPLHGLDTGEALGGGDIVRLTRLMQHAPMLVAVRTVSECSTLWLHGLFAAGYHAVSGVALPRAVVLALCVYGLPHFARVLL